MDLADPVATALLALESFDRAGIPTALVGGLALATYGEPRETTDADLAVSDLAAADAREILRSAGANAVVAFDGVRYGGLAITRITVLPGGGYEGLNVVDLVRPRSDRYAAAAVARAVPSTLRGRAARIVTPDDFVVFKLLADRDLDLKDAESVLRRSAEYVDVSAIDAECARLAAEIPDHDVLARWAEVGRRAASPYGTSTT